MIQSFVTGTGKVPDTPDPRPAGDFAAANLAFKGLGPAGEDTAPREAAIVFDKPVPGQEWYETEHDPLGRPFRWSGPLTHSAIDLHVDTGADLQLELRVLDAIAPDVLDGLRLEVHGEEISLRAAGREDGGQKFSALVPQRVAASGERHRVRLDLHVPRTVSARDVDPDGGDARPVGIAVSWVGLRRAGPEESTYRRAATSRRRMRASRRLGWRAGRS